jgi:hypothetical protein
VVARARSRIVFVTTVARAMALLFVKQLPCEVRLMILEFAVDGADLAELDGLGTLCRSLRARVVQAFVMRDHQGADGRRMVVFCDSELGFKRVRELIPGRCRCEYCGSGSLSGTGMREKCISLTCEVSSEGRMWWWLTRESGRGPPDCTEGPECHACERSEESDRRRSYLVLKCRDAPLGGKIVGRGEVAIGDLSVENLDMLRMRVIGDLVLCLRKAPRRGWRWRRSSFASYQMRLFFLRVGAGAYSSTDCACTADEVCSECLLLEKEGTRFVLARKFNGFEHSSPGQFWGVTDAVGFVDVCIENWLTCWWTELQDV